MRRGALLTALVAACLSGCADDGVRSCRDPLGGVWTARGERYHVLDHGGRVEVYPMFDTTVPPGGSKHYATVAYTPRVLDFERTGDDVLTGTMTFRVIRSGTPGSCMVRWPARIRDCRGTQMRLAVRDGSGEAPCDANLSDTWTELALRRE